MKKTVTISFSWSGVDLVTDELGSGLFVVVKQISGGKRIKSNNLLRAQFQNQLRHRATLTLRLISQLVSDRERRQPIFPNLLKSENPNHHIKSIMKSQKW